MIGVDLGNLYPPVHYAIALFHITRMEKADDWAQQEYMTPAVCNLLEDLDRERLALAAAFAVTTRNMHQSCAIAGKVEIAPLSEILAEVVKHRKGVNGPKSLDSRYVTEHVPYGRLTTLGLEDMMGIDLPLHRAGVLMFSSLYRHEFTSKNCILPELSAIFADAQTLRRVTTGG